MAKPRPKLGANHPFNLFLIFCLICLLRPIHVMASNSPDAIAVMENLVNGQFFPQSNAVGLGLSVVSRDGSLHYSQGFGHRDLESDSLFDPKTLLPIAHVTQTFVSTLVVKILSQKFPQYGESVLEMPITDLAREYKLVLNDRFRTEGMSFRDLLSLRSCTHSSIIGVLYGAVNDSQEFIYRGRYEKAHCPFRTGIGESHHSYLIAGDVLAQIAGKSFETLCRDFLDILGMKDSRFLSATEDLNEVPNLVQGYYNNPLDGKKRSKIDPNLWRQFSTVNPSTGLLSTPHDMLKLMSFLLNEGQVEGKQIVSKEAMAWLIRTAIPLSHDYGYGLGVLLEYAEVAGQAPIKLSYGIFAPVLTFMTIDPSSGVAIFSSSNGPFPNEIVLMHHGLHLQIIASLSGSKLSLPSNKMADETKKFSNFLSATGDVLGGGGDHGFVKNKGKISLHVCSEDATVGHYGNPTHGGFEILEQNGGLVIKYGNLGEGVLTKVADCDYQVKWSFRINPMYVYVGDSLEIVDIFSFHKNNVHWTLFKDVDAVVFERDLCLEKLPKIPFGDPDCDHTTKNDGIGHVRSTWLMCIAMILWVYKN